MEIFNSSYIGKSYVAQLVFENIKDSVYVAVGGSSPWPEESSPPPTSSYLSSVPDTFLFVEAARVLLVREDNEGDLSLEDKSYLELPSLDTPREIRNTRPNAIYAEFNVPSLAVQAIDSNVNDYRAFALYHTISWTQGTDLSNGWTTATPTEFIMDKAFFFPPRAKSSLIDSTIKFVKRF